MQSALPTSESASVYPNGSVQFAEAGGASLRVHQTMGTSFDNTGYVKDEDIKSYSLAYGESQMQPSSNLAEPFEYQGLHYADLQQVPSGPRKHLYSPYLPQIGAQFDVGGPCYNDDDDDDEEDPIAPTPSTAVADGLNPAADFSGNIRGSFEATAPIAALQDLKFTEILAEGDRVFQQATLEKGPTPDNALAAEPLEYGAQRPGIIVNDPLGRPSIPLADDFHFTLLEDEDTTPQTLVEQTFKLVDSLNKLWLLELDSDQDLYIKCSMNPSEILFELGVQTLQRCYCGTLPSSFDALFAFMHVAFAFSRIMHGDGGSYYWDGFSQDAYCWHYTISDPEEANLFARVWHRLWRPRATMEIYVQDNNTSNAALLTPSFAAESRSIFSMPEALSHASNLGVIDRSHVVMPGALMSGMVIKGCSGFLDSKISLTMKPN